MSEFSVIDVLGAIAAASETLSSRKDEINRLNVFPVPDGDTGTNMSLTLESVVRNLQALPAGAPLADVRHAITTGALMGARGNSGVITSQILRGLCEGAGAAERFDTAALAASFAKAVEVSFQAVRKPVEGTILTVLKDSAEAAKEAEKRALPLDGALESIVTEAYASVHRTPELLPVLKENNVVDAGGFGLAILFDGFVTALLGKDSGAFGAGFETLGQGAPKVEIEQINDWEGSEFRYCNEFLVESDTLDKDAALDFLATMGDCELCVGSNPRFKVHVHSNRPDEVLAYFLDRGQVFEVFIHNMDLQSAERNEKLAAEQGVSAEPKHFGVVAVCAGEGNAKILENLGVDVVVSGGQTMNPSTADLLAAVQKANAENVVILPNNSNIIMAANTAAELADVNCGVVPTKSVPQAFAAMFGYDPEGTLEDNLESMADACSEVKTGEVTTAIKDSHDSQGNPIAEGDVIGIADGSIDAVGATVQQVVMDLLESMDAADADTLTLLAGEGYPDEELDALVAAVQEAYDDLEIDAHRGEQPLYPVVLSLE